ncbi:DUF2231 domain-containing protein [Actinoplanes sp. NPDC049265]|uniref:DUF2231 domain-containing protein n=1 Tax=Actinoplanes sp. NPDC049265 TaxID=3363902 RepID=UPI00371D58EB
MFDQINGLPVHALVVHAVVVFVPLLAIGAIVYALAARLRPRIDWAVGLLAIVAPITALVAMLSGNQLHQRLLDQGLKGRGAEIIADHQGFGTLTFWFTLGLGIVTLVMLALSRRPSAPRAAGVGLSVVMVLLGAVSAYFCFRTGDSGATAVWGQY